MTRGRSTRGRARKKSQGRGQAKERATIQKIASGAGFLIFETTKTDDLYISPREAKCFLDGDILEVNWSPRHREVFSIKLLERLQKKIYARFERSSRGPDGFLLYEKKRTREEILVRKVPPGLRPGDWVEAELLESQGNEPLTAKILKTLGPTLPASFDVQWIASDFGLTEERTKEALEEAHRLKDQVQEEIKKGRRDLRSMPFITIDGETARDFDDAVYVEKKGNDYVLWVAIADVSFYVKRGGPLDLDSYAKGTSVYFPERAFHMLPEVLSEKLCSLRPNEAKLTMVCKMTFSRLGQCIDTEVFNAVIESKRRATYTEIEAEHERSCNDPNWEFKSLYELYSILRKMRQRQGSLDFDFPEPEVKVDPNGEPISIEIRERLDAHRLIEAFMVSANEAVTEWMLKRKAPFIYRIHETPSREAFERFAELASHSGLSFPFDEGLKSPLPVSDFLKKIDSHPAKQLLHMELLRSLKQAVYSAKLDIHYGLASKGYTHFTSPIRRYPDLVVHRLLKQEIEQISQRDRMKPQDLEGIATHCSRRERLASDAEREALRLKQVRILAKSLGSVFDSKIIGMNQKGLFLQIRSPFVEGFLGIDRIPGEAYTFDQERMQWIAKRSKKRFRIGDEMKVRVASCSIERRQIDFELES